MPTVGTTPFYNEIILSYTIAFYSLLQYNLQKYKIFGLSGKVLWMFFCFIVFCIFAL